MKKTIFSTLIILSLTHGLKIFASPAIADLLLEQILSGEISTNQAIDIIEKLPMDRMDSIEAAELLYFQGVLELYDGDTAVAEELFFEVKTLLTPFVEQNLPDTDLYRIYADTLSQLVDLGEIGFKLKWSSYVKKYAEKALALDPQNVKARRTLLIFLYHAPKIVGGSGKDALEGMREMTEAAPRMARQDAFFTNLWVAIFLHAENRQNESELYLEKAFRIYPMTDWTRNLLYQYELSP